MIFAIYDFTPFENELPEFNLKELLNIEDLNHAIFDEVFNSLKPHQQEQYLAYKNSEEAKKYRKERNEKLPYVNLDNLPEVLDDALLQKVMLYQKEGEVRDAIFDLLSENHKGQIARFESKKREEEKEKRRALMTEDEKRKEKEWWDKYDADLTPRFMGNLFEPATVYEYILKYGIDPRNGNPETGESFQKKYTYNSNGEIIPRENKE
jgi:DNA repair photolyase